MAYILVVEDDPEINALMALTLRVEDYEVAQARDGKQALQMVVERLPDLILLDVMMPHLSGYEVARVLQKDAATRHIPLIFVTAKSDTEDRVRGLEMAIDYVCKPFAAPELIARVRAALRMSKLQEQLRASNEKLAQLATTDSLTGLCNRRHFYLELEDEMQRARRFGQPMSVIMFDLDHFKRINDTWGHPQGDLVLQAFARVLENTKRSIDTVARLGGEEFGALLPATGFDGACAFAEKVRQSTAKMNIPGLLAEGAAEGAAEGIAEGSASSDDANNWQITVSVGAAVAERLEPLGETFIADVGVSNAGDVISQISGSEMPHVPVAKEEATGIVEVNQTSPLAGHIEAGTEVLAEASHVQHQAVSPDAFLLTGAETVSVRSSVRSALQDAAMRAAQGVENGLHDLQDADAKLSPEGQEFVKVADRMLYQSKAAGRNCTTAEIIFEVPTTHSSVDDAPDSEIARS